MLIPLEWLSEFVRVEASPEELAERLTLTGNEIEEIVPSATGPVLKLKLTPNRADMLSVEGAAREIGALYEIEPQVVSPDLNPSAPPEPAVTVTLAAPDLCPRYVGLIIRGVRVGPSPSWLARRLESAGMRSISNVVDVTNYVMWELGQPLHAFDLDLLQGHRIIVRRATDGEQMTLINGSLARLTPEMLVIADGVRPVALAGVMGGEESEVTPNTRNVFLESAYFDPASTRRTARMTGVSSQSSYRFERGVDPNGVLRAALRAAELITRLAGGAVSVTIRDEYPKPIEPRQIVLRPERCTALLGTAVPGSEICSILTRLGCTVDSSRPQEWQVSAPSRRPDLQIEEDLIEEVGRIHGYDRLPETLPCGAVRGGHLSREEQFTRRVRAALTGQGFLETVGNTLVSPGFLDSIRLKSSLLYTEEHCVSVRNPHSEEYSMLRPSLVPGLLSCVQRNVRRGRADLHLFEIGRIHRTRRPGDGTLADEALHVAGVLLGSKWSGSWNAGPSLQSDFYAARGTVEALLSALGVSPETWSVSERSDCTLLHPGRQALFQLGGSPLAVIGELHPEVSRVLDLPRGVLVFEIGASQLCALPDTPRAYVPPSRFPGARRDIAVVVGPGVTSEQVRQVLASELAGPVRTVRLFDVYSGPGLAPGQTSLAFALDFGSTDRTLTDEEIESRLERARSALRRGLGAEVRS